MTGFLRRNDVAAALRKNRRQSKSGRIYGLMSLVYRVCQIVRDIRA